MAMPHGQEAGAAPPLSVLLLAAAAAVLCLPAAGALAQVTGVTPRDGLSALGPRPFRHAEHLATIACGDCHRPEDRHRGAGAWTPPDCAACHHGPEVVAGCTTCHDRDALAGERMRPVSVAFSVWAEPRARPLPFDHDRHGAVGCLECHRQAMSRPPAECAACHENHHRAEADCAVCHESPTPTAHDRGVHVGCAGAGCHAGTETLTPLASRASCLVCHEDRRPHRPEGICVQCHVLPRTSTLAREPSGR